MLQRRFPTTLGLETQCGLAVRLEQRGPKAITLLVWARQPVQIVGQKRIVQHDHPWNPRQQIFHLEPMKTRVADLVQHAIKLASLK